MVIGKIVRQTGRLALAAAVAMGVTLTLGQPAKAISGGEAAAIGLGSFAFGTALGAGAANPYYNGYYNYPYGYAYPAAPAPGYYPAAPAYPPRSCWDPYRRYYYAC
jgi:hypothetical protein